MFLRHLFLLLVTSTSSIAYYRHGLYRRVKHGRVLRCPVITDNIPQSLNSPEVVHKSKWPCGDDFDKRILSLWFPAILNFAMYPLVGAVDTYFVGKMNDVSALAGQGAANQVFNSAYFIMSFLPSVVSPLVAQAIGAGDEKTAQQRVGEAILLGSLFGIVGTFLITVFPEQALATVLPRDSIANVYAKPYLIIRGLTILPALLSTVAFSAFRGRQDIVTP